MTYLNAARGYRNKSRESSKTEWWIVFSRKHGGRIYLNEKSRQQLFDTLGSSANNTEKVRRLIGGSTGSSTRDSGEVTDPAACIPGLTKKQRWVVVG